MRRWPCVGVPHASPVTDMVRVLPPAVRCCSKINDGDGGGERCSPPPDLSCLPSAGHLQTGIGRTTFQLIDPDALAPPLSHKATQYPSQYLTCSNTFLNLSQMGEIFGNYYCMIVGPYMSYTYDYCHT